MTHSKKVGGYRPFLPATSTHVLLLLHHCRRYLTNAMASICPDHDGGEGLRPLESGESVVSPTRVRSPPLFCTSFAIRIAWSCSATMRRPIPPNNFMMMLKIRHGCHADYLSDGSLTISGRFHYQLPVDATVVSRRI